MLSELNRAFYAAYAREFARTRRGWLHGYDRILPHLLTAANVLDLGCGNGRLLAFLATRGWRGAYVGLDDSPELLRLAEAAAVESAPGIEAQFLLADLMTSDWPAALDRIRTTEDGARASTCEESWQPDAIVALAVLHHMPGAANRANFVRQCAGLLREGGLLLISTWQFVSSVRLRARILPWQTVGLRDSEVDPEDYLLAWGEGKVGHRYCAYIQLADLRVLAEEAGLALVETFYSDGHEGNLNLYGVFQRSSLTRRLSATT